MNGSADPPLTKSDSVPAKKEKHISKEKRRLVMTIAKFANNEFEKKEQFY
jgi:hypothetical protein